MHCIVNMLWFCRPDHLKDEGHLNWVCGRLWTELERLNHVKYLEMQTHVRAAIDNIVAGARYRFLASDGELLGTVSEHNPLVWTCVLLHFHQCLFHSGQITLPVYLHQVNSLVSRPFQLSFCLFVLYTVQCTCTFTIYGM